MGMRKYIYYLFISKQPLIMKLGILMTCTDMIFSNLGSPGMAIKKWDRDRLLLQTHQKLHIQKVFSSSKQEILVEWLHPLKGHDWNSFWGQDSPDYLPQGLMHLFGGGWGGLNFRISQVVIWSQVWWIRGKTEPSNIRSTNLRYPLPHSNLLLPNSRPLMKSITLHQPEN